MLYGGWKTELLLFYENTQQEYLAAEVSLLHAWRAVWVASACAQTSREPARGIEKWLAARSSRTLAKKKR